MIQRIKTGMMRRRIIIATFLTCMLAGVYWLLIASDRFVSEAHVIIQRTDVSGGQAMDFSSLLNGTGGSRAEQLLLRDHLLSLDMLRKIDTTLKLRDHYSDKQRDPLSRLWNLNTSIEWLHRYFLSRVSVELDDYAGVLVIKAQAYDPKTAHAISSLMLQEGGRFMNDMARGLAQEQVNFLEQQLVLMNERALQARQAVLNFQNQKELVSPQGAAEALAGIISRLDGQRSDLQTQLSASQAYLVPNHPTLVLLNQQLQAVEKQITQEKAKLASPAGKTLNRTVEEFQRLELAAAFAQDVYKTALVALEKGRLESMRTIKKVSVLQTPSLPEYPLEPRRFYNTLVFVLIALLLAGKVHLLEAIVRDHKD